MSLLQMLGNGKVVFYIILNILYLFMAVGNNLDSCICFLDVEIIL